MKKTLIMAFAFAFAVVFGASATGDWFDGKIGNAWPTATGMNGSWSNITGGTYIESGAKVLIDADVEEPLTFTAENKVAVNDLTGPVKSAAVTASIYFNAFPEGSITASTDAKAGVIVVKPAEGDNYFMYLAKDPEGPTNVWTKLNDKAAPADDSTPVTVTTVLTKSGDVVTCAYTIDGTEFNATVVAADEFGVATFSGSGAVSLLQGDKEANMIDFTIPSLAAKNVVIDKVLDAQQQEIVGNEGTYSVVYGSTVTILFKPIDGYAFALDATKQAEVTINAAGEIAAASFDSISTAAEGKAKIGTVYYLTLSDAIQSIKPGETAELLADEIDVSGANYSIPGNGSAATPAGDYTIDLGGYTLSFAANATKLQIYNTTVPDSARTLTIQNGFIMRNEESASATWLIRSYVSRLTLNNVGINGATIAQYELEKSHNCLGVVEVTNGSLDLLGTTSITNVASGVSAIGFGNYANGSTYTNDTLTVNTTGKIDGNIMLGAKMVTTTPAALSEVPHIYAASFHNCYVKPADVASAGFAALVGEFPTAVATSDYTNHAYDCNQLGEFFLDLDDAVTAVQTTSFTKTLKLLADADEAIELNCADPITIDLNGKNVAVTDCDAITSAGAGAVTITGAGTVTASTSGYDVRVTGEGTVAIANGSFIAAGANVNGNVSITGGTFSADPADKVASGYKAVEQQTLPTSWVVEPLAVVQFSVTAGANSTLSALTINADPVADLGSLPNSVTEGDVIVATFAADSGFEFTSPETGVRNVTATTENVEIVGPDAVAVAGGGDEVVPGDNINVATEVAANAVDVALDDAQKTLDDTEAYKALFNRVVTPDGEGGYNVTFVLTKDAKDDIDAAIEGASLGVLSLEGESGTVENVPAEPGLYYSVATGTSLDGMVEGPRTMATGDTINLEIPAIDGSSGFYEIKVNACDNKAAE